MTQPAGAAPTSQILPNAWPCAHHPRQNRAGLHGGRVSIPKAWAAGGVLCWKRTTTQSTPDSQRAARHLPEAFAKFACPGLGGGWQGCLLPHPRILPSLTLDSRTRGPGIQRGPEFLPKHLLAPHDSQGPKVQAQRKEAPAWGRGRGRARLAASRHPPPLPADTTRDCQAVDDREPGQQPWQDFPGS